MRQELPHRPWMEHSPQQNLVSVVPTLAVIFFKMHFLSLLSVYHSCFLLHNAVMMTITVSCLRELVYRLLSQRTMSSYRNISIKKEKSQISLNVTTHRQGYAHILF